MDALNPTHRQEAVMEPTQQQQDEQQAPERDPDAPAGPGAESARPGERPAEAAIRRMREEGTKKAVDPGEQAVHNVTAGSTNAEDLANATSWFLSDEDAGVMGERTFGLNVAAQGEHVIEWTVRAISREQIRQIRKLARPARMRASANAGEIDDMKANLGIACAGTLTPDLNEMAARIGVKDIPEMLKRRFSHKPGLIDQIASEVLTVSGYDEDDVRDIESVKD